MAEIFPHGKDTFRIECSGKALENSGENLYHGKFMQNRSALHQTENYLLNWRQIMSTTRDLREIPFFSEFPPDEAKTLAGMMDEIEFTDGAMIVQENAASIGLFFVVTGRINIFKSDRGSHHSLTILEKNDLFGEVSFIDEKIPSASAQAVGPVKVLKMTTQAFKTLTQQNPSLGIKLLSQMIRELSRRFRAISEGIDVKSSDQTIAEIVATGRQVKISTNTTDYICKILYSDNKATNPMLRLDLKGQQILLPFSQIRLISLPGIDGKFA